MAELRDAPAEKKVRTRPLRMFTGAVTALENSLVEDKPDEDVETALQTVTAAFTTSTELTWQPGSQTVSLRSWRTIPMTSSGWTR